MAKKKKPIKLDDPEQSARFIELAERIKADDDKERFNRTCKTIIKSKPKPSGNSDLKD